MSMNMDMCMHMHMSHVHVHVQCFTSRAGRRQPAGGSNDPGYATLERRSC